MWRCDVRTKNETRHKELKLFISQMMTWLTILFVGFVLIFQVIIPFFRNVF